ncbi:MAG TPA: FtsX-like permease family protein [Puia sp.]|nr:FtsX-like permease family protein [Puia sp.]
MLRTYLRIAARILTRNKLYTLINVLGLALGVCTCIIIWLVDSAELSFDRFHPDGDRIYRVVLGGSPVPMVLPPMPEAMRATVPGLQSMTAYFPFNESRTVQVPLQGHPTREFQPTLPDEDGETAVILADTGWFHVFSYRWLAGEPAAALKMPYQVVLTASAAKRYFGNIPPAAAIGRELIYADSLHVHVSGVVRDWTHHSELAYTDIISLPTVDASFLKQTYQLHDWTPRLGPDRPWSYVYVKLVKRADTDLVVTQMNRIAAQHQLRTPAGPYTQALQPLSDIHFDASYMDRRHRAHLPTLYALAGIALFILILAAVNYINLATAQSLQRAKEIGVRKVLGSGKNSLIGQFLVETGVLTTLALLIAVGMVWPALRYFRDYIPAGIHFNPFTAANLLFLAGVLIVVTLAAGFYPARVLAGYQPVESLKGSGSIRGGGKWWVRRSLVVFQFAISLVFIIVTLVVGRQIRFMLNTDYGFRSNAIVTVQDDGDKIELLEQRYRRLPGVAEVIRESNPPIGMRRIGGLITYKGKQVVQVLSIVEAANDQFIPFYDMRMVAGRNIRHSDSLVEYVINETAARRLGFATPSAAVGQLLGEDNPVPIVGVVADYHEASLKQAIEPIIIGHQPGMEHALGIRLASAGKGIDNVKATLDAMEKTYKEIYPGVSFSYKFMDESIRHLYETEQKTAALVKLAMGLAIFISCMGLFGLSLFTAERRAGEIGIRKVLGATTVDIALLLNRQYIRLVLLALVIASPIAWILAHQWLRSFAYRIAVDGWVFVLAGLSAIGLALATVSYQSIRAALANPVHSLRAD